MVIKVYKPKYKELCAFPKKITSILAITTMLTSSYCSEVFATSSIDKTKALKNSDSAFYVQLNKSLADWNQKTYPLQVVNNSNSQSIAGGWYFNLGSLGRVRAELELQNSNLLSDSSASKETSTTIIKFSPSSSSLGQYVAITDSEKKGLQDGFKIYKKATIDVGKNSLNSLVTKGTDASATLSAQIDFTDNKGKKYLQALGLVDDEITQIKNAFDANNQLKSMTLNDTGNETKNFEAARTALANFLDTQITQILDKKEQKFEGELNNLVKSSTRDLATKDLVKFVSDNAHSKIESTYELWFKNNFYDITPADNYTVSTTTALDKAFVEGVSADNFYAKYNEVLSKLKNLDFTTKDIDDIEKVVKKKKDEFTKDTTDGKVAKGKDAITELFKVAAKKAHDKKTKLVSIEGFKALADGTSGSASPSGSDSPSPSGSSSSELSYNVLSLNRAIVSVNYDMNVSGIPRLKVHGGIGAGFGMASVESFNVITGKKDNTNPVTKYNDLALMYRAGLTYQLTDDWSVNTEYRSTHDWLYQTKDKNSQKDDSSALHLSQYQLMAGLRYEF